MPRGFARGGIKGMQRVLIDFADKGEASGGGGRAKRRREFDFPGHAEILFEIALRRAAAGVVATIGGPIFAAGFFFVDGIGIRGAFDEALTEA